MAASAPLLHATGLGGQPSNLIFSTSLLEASLTVPLPDAMPALQQPRRALVVYGSETGNAQDVAEEMGRIAERLRFDTDVAELNAISLVCQSMAVPVRAAGPC